MKMFRLGMILAVGGVLSTGLTGCGPREPEPAPVPGPVAVPDPVAAVPEPEPIPEPVPVPEPEPAKPAYTGVQESPKSLINAFFQAAATNGVKEMTQMSMPRVHGEIKDPEWLALWNAYTVSSIGENLEERPTPNEGADKTVRIQVIFQHPTTGEVLDERLSLSFKTDRWYWDEK